MRKIGYIKETVVFLLYYILAFKETLLKTKIAPTKPVTAYVTGICQTVIIRGKIIIHWEFAHG